MAQYIAFRQKKIAKLFKKSIFKIFIIANISNHIQIFNLRFINKIKNQWDINKVYKKSQLIIQTYNNNKKILY